MESSIGLKSVMDMQLDYIAANDMKVDKYLTADTTVLPAKSDSDLRFCLQNYQGTIIDRSLVY